MPVALFEKRGAGWVQLAGEFPPTLNKEDDVVNLKPEESPDCYGVDPDAEGLIKTASIATGTARTAPTGTGSYTGYNFYYDRLWKVRTGATTILDYGAPKIRDAFFRQGLGKFEASATIITFMPALGASMWVATATGSHLIQNANDKRGFFGEGKFVQAFPVNNSARAITLDGIPYSCHSGGVFSYDGREVKELTRNVRNNLGSFANQPILANYNKKWIIGTNKFIIDTKNGKLFDYGTTGFRFTSRSISQAKEFAPFEASHVALIIKHSSTAGGTVKWQTQSEDGSWQDEENIKVNYSEDEYTRVNKEIINPKRMCHRFRLRLTSLSSNIQIREIQLKVQNFATETFSE